MLKSKRVKIIQERVLFYKDLLEDDSLPAIDRARLEAKVDALIWALMIAT